MTTSTKSFKNPASFFEEVCCSYSKDIQINPDCRKILINWFIDIAKDCGFKYDILTYAIVLMDRFFTKYLFSINEYQIVGSAAYMLSIKIFHNGKVNDLVSLFKFFSSNAFTHEKLCAKELFMLQNFDFKPMEFMKNYEHGETFDIDFSTIYRPVVIFLTAVKKEDKDVEL